MFVECLCVVTADRYDLPLAVETLVQTTLRSIIGEGGAVVVLSLIPLSRLRRYITRLIR